MEKVPKKRGWGVAIGILAGSLIGAYILNNQQGGYGKKIRSQMSILVADPEGKYKFLGGMPCIDWADRFENEKDGFTILRDLKQEYETFAGMMTASDYMPKRDSMRVLRNLAGGYGYDMGFALGEGKWVLSYRTKEDERMFAAGFTLYEPKSTKGLDSVLEGYGREGRTDLQTGINTHVLMNPAGAISDIVTTGMRGDEIVCEIRHPPESMFRHWYLAGDLWKNLALASTQERTARLLEKMAEEHKLDMIKPLEY